MTPTPLRRLRVPDEQWQRWQDAAKRAGTDVSEYVREAVEARIAGGDSGPVRVVTPVKQRPSKRRTEMCEHRRKPDEFCKFCDA